MVLSHSESHLEQHQFSNTVLRIQRELQGIGFHSQAAASKHYITKSKVLDVVV